MRKTLAREIEACRRELGALRARGGLSAFGIGVGEPDVSSSDDEMEVDDFVPSGAFDRLSIENNRHNSRTTPDVALTRGERTERAQRFIGELQTQIHKTGCSWRRKPDGTWSLEPNNGSDTWFVHLVTKPQQITAVVLYIARDEDIPELFRHTPGKITMMELRVESGEEVAEVAQRVNIALARVPMDSGYGNGPPRSQ